MATAGSDGLLLVDKPAGLSSHDVVAIVRRARGVPRAGHTGTLDPFATGLLLVALGRATRLIRFLPAEPKVYRARIAFGTGTDTDDVTGNVVARGPEPEQVVVIQAIRGLTGALEQVPPAFSARHVGGRRAYSIARQGGEPELVPARVTVHQWEVEAWERNVLSATITCSSGTYVRALARDLGRACGTVAHLASLQRTRIGPFEVGDAVTPDGAGDAPMLSAAEALVEMTKQVVVGEDVERLSHGRPVAAHAEGNRAALVDQSGDLLAVAERDGEWWQPRVVMSGA